MNLLTFILLYLYICVFKKGKDWGKETTVNTFATSSFRSIKNFQHTVYWQVGEMGFAWVPQIDWLIDLFFLNYYNYDFCPPTVIYHQPATSQRQTSKVLGPFQFTNIPNWPPPTPQSTLRNQHNSRTSNIPIVTLSCLCKSKSANRIILILSQRKPTMPSQNWSFFLCL